MTVDVLMSATVNVPQDLLDEGKYYTDKSTKITYQNMVILAKTGQFYVVKATLASRRGDHPSPGRRATRRSAWSCGRRPTSGTVDASTLGETTNRLISKYGLPIPEVFPPGNGPIPTPLPTPTARRPSALGSGARRRRPPSAGARRPVRLERPAVPARPPMAHLPPRR